MQLPQTRISTKKTRAHGFIVNSESSVRLGHWFAIIIFNGKFLVVCDGLNKVLDRSDIMINVTKFCDSNHLILRNLNFRCQVSNSLKCGYIALFFIAKASLLNYRNFMKMVTMLNQYSIESREQFVFKYVKRHFK